MNDRTTTAIGQRILDARLAAGITQTQLADAAKVSQRVISSIEIGEVQQPGFVVVAKLCGALGIPVHELADEVAS